MSNRSFCYFLFGAKKCESKKYVRKFITLKINNSFKKRIGFLKSRLIFLNKISVSFLKKHKWPLRNFKHTTNITIFVKTLQRVLLDLRSLNKKEWSLQLISKYCFTLVIRLFAIEKIRITARSCKKFVYKKTFFYNNDYKTCLYLLKQTHPKKINKTCTMETMFTTQYNLNTLTSFKMLTIKHVKDVILQLQFVVLLAPIINITKYFKFYKFCKRPTYLEALPFLSRCLQISTLPTSWLLICDIKKYLKSISHTYILTYFPFPEKYKILLKRWLKVIQKKKLTEFPINNRWLKKKICIKPLFKIRKWHNGLVSGAAISPLISTFILNTILANFFKSNKKHFPEWLLMPNGKNWTCSIYVTRFLLNCINTLIFKVCRKLEIVFCIFLLLKKFKTVKIMLDKTRTTIHTFIANAKFTWLGHIFLILTKNFVYTGTFINNSNISQRENTFNIVICYMSVRAFSNLKIKLKVLIKKIKHISLFIVINQVNLLLQKISKYYSFSENRQRFRSLFFFIDRLFWRELVKKYRYRGIRRPKWVAKTFFITQSHTKKKVWRVHSYYFNNTLKKKKKLWLCLPLFCKKQF